MNDFDLYIAKTQARLAFFLIIILVLLSFGVVAIMLWPSVRAQESIINLIVQVVTGVLALCGSAVAYFFARHRPPSASDNEDPSKVVSKEVTTVTQSIPANLAPLVQPLPEKKA